MSLLIYGDVDYIMVSGEKIYINTDFRLWISYIKAIEEKDRKKIDKLIVKICPFINQYDESSQEAILCGLKSYLDVKDGNDVDENKQKLRATNSNDIVFDLLLDEMPIIADFQREYNINLLDFELCMSWKRFKILLNNMTEESSVSGRIKIREMDMKDVSKKHRGRVMMIKERYKITQEEDNKITLETRNTLMKKYVSERSMALHGKREN